MELQPDEMVLSGKWQAEGGSIVADDVCRRIEWLIESRLEQLAADSTGWG